MEFKNSNAAMRPLSIWLIIAMILVTIVSGGVLLSALSRQNEAFEATQGIDAFLESALMMESDYRQNLFSDKAVSMGQIEQDFAHIRKSLSVLHRTQSSLELNGLSNLEEITEKRITRITEHLIRLRSSGRSLLGSLEFISKSDQYLDGMLAEVGHLNKVSTRIYEQRSSYVLKVFVVSAAIVIFLCLLTIFIFRRLLRTMEEALRIKSESEKVLRIANENAQLASKFKSEFLANVSHEIRTPMQGIVGLIDYLKPGQPLEKQETSIQILQDSANTLLRIVNDILDISSIEAGKIRLKPAAFELSELWSRIQSLYMQRAIAKELTFDGFIDTRLPRTLLMDSDRIFQILSNLVSNAIKFTQSGFVRVSFSLGIDDKNRRWLDLEVSDSGVGIKEINIQSIFEPFCRNPRKLDLGSSEGAGLGLAISRQLITIMGGSIDVESRVNTGTRFKARFPLITEDRTEQSLVEVPLSPEIVKVDPNDIPDSNSGLPRSPFKVLLAEDNPSNRWILDSFLTTLGCTTKVVNDGKEVLDALKTFGCDIIFMDHRMPNMDGMEATKKIRMDFDEPTKSIPIIALTANAMKGDKEKYLNAGFDDYLSKPVDVHDLRAMISKWVVPLQSQFDHRRILRLKSRMKEDQFELMLSTYVKRLPIQINIMRHGMVEGQYKQVKSLSHSLKGSSAMLGALRLAEQLNQIENSEDLLMYDEAYFQKLNKEASDVVSFLATYLNHHPLRKSFSPPSDEAASSLSL